MRPNWFVCKKCFWWKQEPDKGYGYCYHADSMGIEKYMYETAYCSNWTCATCFQSWDDYFFPQESEGLITDTPIYVDHSKCKAVEFGVRL